MRPNAMLAQLRDTIDQIDNQILDLVEQRLTLCREIAAAKDGGNGLKLCPDRQRQVVDRLTDRANDETAPAVPHIWREIMAQAVQVQTPTRILIVGKADRDRRLNLVRQAYGSAAPVEWIDDEADALAIAAADDAIVVLPGAIGAALPAGLSSFDQLRDEQGVIVGRLVGRIAQPAAPSVGRTRSWRPHSWRSRPAAQQPCYPNMRELHRVERRLAARAPLVELNDIDALRSSLAAVARGEAVLVQGGDCVETLREYSPGKIRLTADLLLQLGAQIGGAADVPAVHVARLAGQYAKPRSSQTEIVGGMEIPVYRGDGINGEDADAAARLPDPQRLLAVHDQAINTVHHLWDGSAAGSDPVYISHEALLLNVEQALTQYDERSGRWWAGSGHMLWVGERTRQLDGAHVEYARGIANPIGLKCGPSMSEDELLRLVEVLDPANEAGRLVLIPRHGRDRIADGLPRLMRAMKREGRSAVWCIDPMHGNGRIADGRKVRLVEDIVAETLAFHDIAAAEGIWAGGVHLELTGTDVMECSGGGRRRWLGSRAPYLSGCDPRLNRQQTLELGAAIANWHAPSARRRAG
ncbi:3-deoxy-7-phosphoheptulonate synthase [Sphingomonas jaspsi]|uniref:3-deoxy-7-phosphoheptulonate synthase n=1 Tax=Sphingomonas jaspsi TaxID=392409 RepID=UPI0004ACAFE5|nr:3-deoxy-7-phosphoheptulonate synthase [Sphingomonas jaspsi]